MSAKFDQLDVNSCSEHAVARECNRLREAIQNYNTILNNMINKSLADLLSKGRSESRPKENEVEVAQQELINIKKWEHVQEKQLNYYRNIESRLNNENNSDVVHIQTLIDNLQSQILAVKKSIHDVEVAVEIDERKLISNSQVFNNN